MLESDSDGADHASQQGFDAPSTELYVDPTSLHGSATSTLLLAGDGSETASAAGHGSPPSDAPPSDPATDLPSAVDRDTTAAAAAASAPRPSPAAAAEAALAAASRALAAAEAVATTTATATECTDRSHSTGTEQAPAAVDSSADAEEWFDAMGRPDSDGRSQTGPAGSNSGGGSAEGAGSDSDSDSDHARIDRVDSR